MASLSGYNKCEHCIYPSDGSQKTLSFQVCGCRFCECSAFEVATMYHKETTTVFEVGSGDRDRTDLARYNKKIRRTSMMDQI
ncbi:hypothetical protein JTE90_014637 [Oedothorax gibbosus]|uniref:Uncharacterized protein n=1 Tax=Oedothorax gibbosus TaxID=931172 RepID=A0AAV6V9A1_9ARAC|nr:hypothetical protein JTE90_014637 [Oedothorax gibbosus]